MIYIDLRFRGPSEIYSSNSFCANPSFAANDSAGTGGITFASDRVANKPVSFSRVANFSVLNF